jgi:hypothetical protein
MAADASGKGKYFHVVSFKFKSDLPKEQVKEVERAFSALKTSIPQIKSIDYGTNVSKENFDKGFTHMWVLTFDNAEDCQVYIKHPEHQKFGKLLGGKLAENGVFVLDFVSQQ